MKKLLTVIAWTLALNFLAGVGAIVWLYKSGKLDHEKVQKIKEMVFAPATQPVKPTDDARDPTTEPTTRLEEILAKVSGRSAGEQIEFIQQQFNSQMAILDRRFAELQDQRRQLEQAKTQANKDREVLMAAQKKLKADQEAQEKLANDQSFQETLERYNAMPAKQVKTIFLTMKDDTIIQYFRAMEPRNVAKIVKEFKSPEEMERVAKVMEKMRETQASAKE